MKRSYLCVTAVVLLVAAMTPVWAGGGQEDRSDSLQIVATTQIVGDVVANVVGDRAEVIVLMDEGQNPHAYQATVSDLRAIEDADLVFVNGFNMEESLLGDLEPAAGDRMIVVSDGIEPLEGEHHHHHDEDDHHHDEDDDHHHDDEDDHHHDEDEDHHHDEDDDHHHDDEDDHHHDEDEDHHHDEDGLAADPHVWTDPNNVAVWVDNIAAALASVDRANAETYEANAAAYRSELAAIDEEIRAAVADFASRDLVVDHDAFAYFAQTYDFEVVATIIPGMNDAADPSARDIAEVVETLREHEAPAIFVGQQASPALQRLAQVVSDEVGRPVAILPVLTGTLAPAGEPGDTYLGYLRYNLDQFTLGLAN